LAQRNLWFGKKFGKSRKTLEAREMISNIEKPLQVNSTLSVLLSALGEECEKVLFLLSQLKLTNLTPDQKGDILAELTGLVCHLHVHTKAFPELIGNEILALPETQSED
jgi:hypothetical protein